MRFESFPQLVPLCHTHLPSGKNLNNITQKYCELIISENPQNLYIITLKILLCHSSIKKQLQLRLYSVFYVKSNSLQGIFYDLLRESVVAKFFTVTRKL